MTRTLPREISLLLDDDGSGASLYTRAAAEHVVLADCVTTNGVVSSEMAYFSGSPDSTPDDAAVVDTSYNSSRQWANTTTATLFLDTNVTFTAVLRPEVAQGEWAGTGENGYGNFVCWETTLPSLYRNEAEGTECSGVYDCDHAATPSVTPTPSATSTNSPTQSSNTTRLSQGAIIGIVVGCAFTFLLLLFVSFLILIRHLAVHKGYTGGLYAPFVPKPKPSPPPPGYWGPESSMLNDPDRLRRIEYLGPQPGQVYEATGDHGYEATGDERFPAREIVGVMLPRELPLTTPLPEMAAVGTPVEQFSRGRTRWRADEGPPNGVVSGGHGQ